MATAMEDLQLLQNAERVCDDIWDLVQPWNGFTKETIGKQLVRAADSVGANIAEGYGRYHFGEKIQFLYYARGSLFETKYWLRRAIRRKHITQENFDSYSAQLDGIAKGINIWINSTRDQRAKSKNTKR